MLSQECPDKHSLYSRYTHYYASITVYLLLPFYHQARLDEHGGVAVNLRLRRYAHLRRPAQVRTGAPSWEASWAPPATEADGKRFTAPCTALTA